MNLDKDSIASIVGNENADFLESRFKETTQYPFVNKWIKSLKKQIGTAVNYEKVVNDEMTLEDFEDSLKSNVDVKAKYKGFFIKGMIKDANFYKMLSFFQCNIIPKNDTTNNGVVFYNDNYRFFVNTLDSDNKNIAFLFNKSQNIIDDSLIGLYFVNSDVTEMTDDNVLQLSYDLEDLDYKSNYFDYNTGANLYEIQDSLLKSYSVNPIDYLLTLGLIYRLKNLGWDNKYIDFIGSKNRGFNVLNSNINITLNSVYINHLIDFGYIDEEYSITDSGRSAMLLLNCVAPIDTNNYGNMYCSLSYIVSTQKIAKDKLVYIGADNISLYGIKDEFFIDEKSLQGMATGLFTLDANYALTITNSIGSLIPSMAIGYSPNIKISNTETLDFEINQQLFNTFNDDQLNVAGGLVSIQPYDSDNAVYVNSLIYKLIKISHKNIYPFISKTDRSYVAFKDDSNNIVGLIKTSFHSALLTHKEQIGTQDISLLFNKINKNYSGKLLKGLSITDNSPVIVGVGFVEKSELSSDDFNKISSVPFNELKSTLRTLNKDNYFSDLDENGIIKKVISQRSDDYDKYKDLVQSEMSKKLSALQILQDHFTLLGNDVKQTYYLGIIESYKEKISNFRI